MLHIAIRLGDLPRASRSIVHTTGSAPWIQQPTVDQPRMFGELLQKRTLASVDDGALDIMIPRHPLHDIQRKERSAGTGSFMDGHQQDRSPGIDVDARRVHRRSGILRWGGFNLGRSPHRLKYGGGDESLDDPLELRGIHESRCVGIGRTDVHAICRGGWLSHQKCLADSRIGLSRMCTRLRHMSLLIEAPRIHVRIGIG